MLNIIEINEALSIMKEHTAIKLTIKSSEFHNRYIGSTELTLSFDNKTYTIAYWPFNHRYDCFNKNPDMFKTQSIDEAIEIYNRLYTKKNMNVKEKNIKIFINMREGMEYNI
jgi:hypothetical protein